MQRRNRARVEGNSRCGRRARRDQPRDLSSDVARTDAHAAERARVDRSTIAKLREVARQGALDALAQSRPGRRGKQRDFELEAAQGEAERLRTALAEMAVKLTLAEGKESWG